MKESEVGRDEIKTQWTEVQLETRGQVKALPQASDFSWHRVRNLTRRRFGHPGGSKVAIRPMK